MTTLRELARLGADSFTTGTRPDGTPYTHRTPDAPDWVQSIIFAAHEDGDIFPDDFRYAVTAEALEYIAETTHDPEDRANEFADDTDVYNSDLTDWVGSNALRGSYVDEANEDIPAENFYAGLMRGQALERHEIYAAVLNYLRGIADDEEDEE